LRSAKPGRRAPWPVWPAYHPSPQVCRLQQRPGRLRRRLALAQLLNVTIAG